MTIKGWPEVHDDQRLACFGLKYMYMTIKGWPEVHDDQRLA